MIIILFFKMHKPSSSSNRCCDMWSLINDIKHFIITIGDKYERHCQTVDLSLRHNALNQRESNVRLAL